jgi:hypothetical protein
LEDEPKDRSRKSVARKDPEPSARRP